MRKFILIAGFVLASTAAQAADRSLSLGGIETKYAPAPAKATDTSKTAEVPQAAEAPRAEVPKYVERPAVVEPKPETTKAETTRPDTSTTETARPRAGRAYRPAAASANAGRARPMARRTAYMSRTASAHRVRYSIQARIIGALHRHGIYW
jgi:outer membrane biosynthesis protein TonB